MNIRKQLLKQKQEFMQALLDRQQQNRIKQWFPLEGPVSYDKYPRHMDFFQAGAQYRERCFIAANRIGKTVSGAYETSCHLLGDMYPKWWEGRRFVQRAITGWACGRTNETTRDIIQKTLLGPTRSQWGTGMIPKDRIVNVTNRQGVSEMADTIYVKHSSGGTSALGLKSYQQGRESFEGTAKDIIWLDEEPDISIYNECLIRTATTNGLVYLTFTPLQGLSETVLSFMPGGKLPEQ